ncbi:hypothetical protein HN873_071196, partial [Arachis hypogaea]
ISLYTNIAITVATAVSAAAAATVSAVDATVVVVITRRKLNIESGDSTSSLSSSSFEKFFINVEQSVNISLTDSVIKILDTLYHDRDYARFFVLETIARVPYFACSSTNLICCDLNNTTPFHALHINL